MSKHAPVNQAGIIDFTTVTSKTPAVAKTKPDFGIQDEDSAELKQFGKSISSHTLNSREITPVAMKQYISMTVPEKAKLKTLEEQIESRVESGRFFDAEILGLVT